MELHYNFLNYKIGFDFTYAPIKNGRRQSTYTAFLEPIQGREKLTMRKFAHVTKVHGIFNRFTFHLYLLKN